MFWLWKSFVVGQLLWLSWFESSHGQNFILNIYCHLYWKDENKEKEAGIGPFFEKSLLLRKAASQSSNLFPAQQSSCFRTSTIKVCSGRKSCLPWRANTTKLLLPYHKCRKITDRFWYMIWDTILHHQVEIDLMLSGKCKNIHVQIHLETQRIKIQRRDFIAFVFRQNQFCSIGPGKWEPLAFSW